MLCIGKTGKILKQIVAREEPRDTILNKSSKLFKPPKPSKHKTHEYRNLRRPVNVPAHGSDGYSFRKVYRKGI